jgi:hypothetical protein
MMTEVRCILFPGKPKVLNDVRSPLYYFTESQSPQWYRKCAVIAGRKTAK